ncbi:MAG: hypothetical protein IPJ19_20950 [Planctomycetes bacterium]|nr:hypothetical protein [Planctomycetota bacterium]
MTSASNALDLVWPISGGLNVFVRDRRNDTTELASLSTSGGLSNNISEVRSPPTAVFVVFRQREQPRANDTNGAMDILLHDRDSTGFVSDVCPGRRQCPRLPLRQSSLGREPRLRFRSAGTGGLRLSAQGIAYLSLDSLVFTTTGERPRH